MPRRILLTIAYDGKAYNGFQRQKEDRVPTILGEVAGAVRALTGEDPDLICGSRTDAGVHAICNIAVFDTESRIPAERFAPALNTKLPADIRVTDSRQVACDFHPRHVRTVKTYEYHIYNGQIMPPTRRLYACLCTYPLNVDRMRRAAQYLVGEHDFKSFCSVNAQVSTTVRRILSAEVEEFMPRENTIQILQTKNAETQCPEQTGENNRAMVSELFRDREIVIRVRGCGFLYNMVRIIAGTLMEAGRGSIEPEEIIRILDARDRTKAGPTAPACGLTLVRYEITL